MADNKQRRRRPRGKKADGADTAVTTGGAQPKQQQPAAAQAAKGQNAKGKGGSQPKAQAQAKGKAQGQGQQKKGQAQQGGAKAAAAKGKSQPKAQPKVPAKGQAKGPGKAPAQSGKQGQGQKKQALKPKKQERQQKNKQNVNRAKKASKNAKDKVSDDKQRKKKQEDKQRINLILKAKFQNPQKKQANGLESHICQHLVALEASTKDFKDDLKALGIVAAREIAVAPGKKAICVFVPFVQHTAWQKIQDRVTRELEKKFSGQDVLFIAQRKVMKLNQIKNNFPRPRNQTITSVHEQILDDIVYPTRIVGKRTRFRVGGKRLLKVQLDPKDSKDIEPKLATYEAVYKKLTKKTVKFMFPRFVI